MELISIAFSCLHFGESLYFWGFARAKPFLFFRVTSSSQTTSLIGRSVREWCVQLDRYFGSVIFWKLFPFSRTRSTVVPLRVENEKIFSKSNRATIDRGPMLLFCKAVWQHEFDFRFLCLFGYEWSFCSLGAHKHTHFGESLYFRGFARAKPFLFLE